MSCSDPWEHDSPERASDVIIRTGNLPRRRCYLSGPIRRLPREVAEALFDSAELVLTRAGWDVVNPSRVDREARARGEGPPVDDGTPEACRWYADRDTDIVINQLQAERGDAVVVVPGGDVTRGSRAECATARWVRLPVMTLPDALDPDTYEALRWRDR